jgi:outer membrane protein assembly factor BamB
VIISMAAVLVAGCGREDGEAQPAAARPPERAWQTTAWPMVRGGPQLQGRVHDPVPRQPAVEWIYHAGGAVSCEPAAADGLVVIGDQRGTVHALDPAAKSVRWTFTAGDAVEATPAITATMVLVGANDERLRALHRDTGKLAWEITGKHKFATGAVVIPGPAGGERVLVNGYDGIARCLDAADGRELWHYRSDEYINGAPAVLDGELVAFGGCDAMIRALRLTDGTVAAELDAGAQVTTSVASAGAVVYACTYAGQVVAADLRAGRMLWVHAIPELGFGTAPAVDERCVYVGARDRHLHAIDRQSGAGVWTFKTGGGIEGAPLVFDDAVVCGSGDGRLYAVDKRDGRELWRLDLGAELAAAPAFAGGRILVGGTDGSLFVVR